MKKRTVLYGAIAMSTALLIGCMGGDSSKPDVNDDGEPIVYLGNQTGSNPKLPEGDTYEDNEYTRVAEKELGIEIVNEFEAEGEDYDRQVALAISSGELPDIMQVSEEELKDLYESDLIADLSEVYDEYASDYIKETYDSYDVSPLDNATFDEGLYGMPAVVNVTAPGMVWIRSDWLEELDLHDAEDDNLLTLDELEEIAEAFIENDLGETGKPVGISFVDWLNERNFGGTFTMTTIASAYDAYPNNYIEDEDGNLTNGSLTPQMKEALNHVKGWYDNGILDSQFGTRSWDDIMALAVNEQTGIVTGAWHMPDWGLSNVKEMNPDAVFEPFAITDDNGKVNVANIDPTGSYAVVSKDFEHPEILMEILNLFYDDLKNEPDLEEKFPGVYEYQVLDVDASTRPLNMEIMNSTSELDDYKEIRSAVNGEIEIEDIQDVRSQVLTESIMKYDQDPENAETVEWALYHSRMKGLELGDFVLENNYINWTTPVFFGSTPAIEQYGGNLGSMEDEEFIKIVTGEESIDHFETFVEMWHEQGGDEILSEIEKELNN